jgi:prefoldin subunit 5
MTAVSFEILFALIPSLGAAVGVWVSLNSEVTKLKGRIIHLESDRADLKQFMQRTAQAIEDIRVILAKQTRG